MACLHLHRHELDCAIYVDTGYAYPETLALVEYARTMIPVHTVESNRNQFWIPADLVPSDWTETGQAITVNRDVIIKNYHDCCFESISRPLMQKAAELGVKELFNGQRNEENRKSISRDGDIVWGIIRRQPIEKWTIAEVFAYLATKMEIPAHYAFKHSSLDCFDCTAYRKDSVDRVEWMRDTHPDLYQRYAKRSAMLDAAIKEAM